MVCRPHFHSERNLILIILILKSDILLIVWLLRSYKARYIFIVVFIQSRPLNHTLDYLEMRLENYFMIRFSFFVLAVRNVII